MLARNPPSRTTGSELLEQVRQLHPHAKRALLVPSDTWADRTTAEAIRGSLALGRIDYYVASPAGSPDEVFHEAVSSFLLEWARDRRLVPQTVHIVGETWSGRAYELRKVFEQCAIPHTFCLADSDQGRELLAGAGADAKLPLMVLPDGRVLNDPSNAEIARGRRGPGWIRGARLRRRHRRRRAGGPVRGRLRRLRGDAHPRGGRGRHRWAGEVELADPQLPGLRQGRQRQPACRAGLRAGVGLRGELRAHASGDRPCSLGAPAQGVTCGRAARQRGSGDPRHRRHLPPLGCSLAGGFARRRRFLRRPTLGGARTEREERRTSLVAETLPVRQPCTSRATPDASPSLCARRRSRRGCRTTWCEQSRRRRTWRCARAPRWSAGEARVTAATGPARARHR